VRKKHATVASVFDRVPLNVSFRRTLTGHNLYLWHDLVTRISHVQLNNNTDAFRWNLTQAVRSPLAQCIMHLLAMVMYSLTNICGN